MRVPGVFLLLALTLTAVAAVESHGGPNRRSAKLRKAVEAVQPAVVKVFGLKGFRGIFGYRTGVIVHEPALSRWTRPTGVSPATCTTGAA